MIRLHKRYSDIVLIGPNVVSLGNPEAIPLAYGVNRGSNKVSQSGNFCNSSR